MTCCLFLQNGYKYTQCLANIIALSTFSLALLEFKRTNQERDKGFLKGRTP
jgi:hypothetical protein